MDIDVVITWVDGSDPQHCAKRRAFLPQKDAENFEDIAGKQRYDDSGEILYCVASILRFAPFVHKIFIVTDNQTPPLSLLLESGFPASSIPVEIVDHRTVFRGYEQYLPTFNSLSIETMLYRIPGLSEHFVYMNDDLFIASPISPHDWFVDGKPVCYGYRFNTGWARFLRWIKPSRHGHKPFGFKDSMLNAADILHSGHFIHISHTPHAMLKSVFEEYYESAPDAVVHNIRNRFREPSQFNPQSLFYTIAESQGKCVCRRPENALVFIKSKKGNSGYMRRKLAEADSKPGLLFGCVNSLSENTGEEIEMFREWMDKRLGISSILKRK